MLSKRDFLIFLAGAMFLHTLSHLMGAFIFTFPYDFKFIVLTSNMNLWIIIISAVLTLLFLWWAERLSKRK